MVTAGIHHAQHLLDQHLVLRRRDLGDLEGTPTTASRPPSVSTPCPANNCNHTASRSWLQTNNRSAQQPDRTACCARRGGGRWAPARSSSDSGGGEGEKQIEVAALKSTGSRRPAHRSASTTRAAHRTPNSSAFYLQTGSASAVTALASPQLPVK